MSAELARVTRAYLMAALAHADQRRAGSDGVPYINHPAEVAELVASTGAEGDVVIAAILHDVLEDSDFAAVEIKEHFGGDVAEMVEALTTPADWEALPRLEKKRRQAAHIAAAAPAVRLIKIADQTSNLGDIARDPAAWDSARAEEDIAGRLLVVAACRGTHAELEDAFDAAVARARAAIARRDG